MFGPAHLPVNMLGATAGLSSNGECVLIDELNQPGLLLQMLSVFTVDRLHELGRLQQFLTCDKDGLMPDGFAMDRFFRGSRAECRGNRRCVLGSRDAPCSALRTREIERERERAIWRAMAP